MVIKIISKSLIIVRVRNLLVMFFFLLFFVDFVVFGKKLYVSIFKIVKIDF